MRLPQLSTKTVVEAWSFHDGLWRPSWKLRASTMVFKDRRESTVLPRQSQKTVVEARSFHNSF
ncbi:hypothetical protein TIFTF001_016580 [Ficus carica]|uniref:Uncharacterized protein n=1 Tax=Ficus carica TaxID=3494 RepID=A0AA88A7Y5_FICCA|nr:hypothetical protein TIFTF001_016580 [Ficus carica]